VDTRESIEFLEVEIKCLEKEIEICNPNDDIDIQVIEANKNIIIKYNQVIILLQQGEKYKKKYKKYKLMWKDLEPFKEILVTDDYFISKYGKESLGMKMYRLEQKYLPKETNEYKEGEE